MHSWPSVTGKLRPAGVMISLQCEWSRISTCSLWVCAISGNTVRCLAISSRYHSAGAITVSSMHISELHMSPGRGQCRGRGCRVRVGTWMRDCCQCRPMARVCCPLKTRDHPAGGLRLVLVTKLLKLPSLSPQCHLVPSCVWYELHTILLFPGLALHRPPQRIDLVVTAVQVSVSQIM